MRSARSRRPRRRSRAPRSRSSGPSTTAASGSRRSPSQRHGRSRPSSTGPCCRRRSSRKRRSTTWLERLPPCAASPSRPAPRAFCSCRAGRDGTAVSLELLRSGEPFAAEQRLAAELCAAQAALVLRAFAADGDVSSLARPALELAGEALAVALQEEDAAAEVVRLAAGVAGASAAVLWESREGGLVPAASWGIDAGADLGAAREVAERALAEPGPVSAHAAGLPQDCAVSTTLPLGRPPLGVLQLFHPAGEEPEAEQLTRLATFGVRAAHALRTGERARLLALELERTRALLEVIVQATAELSVSHTLETAVERVAELLNVDRVAVYLRGAGEGELEEAASRGLAGPHARVADRLLDVALGPSRERTVLEVTDVVGDPRLAAVAAAARETGIGSALAVPLVALGEVVGLLAAYPEGRPAAGEHETALLAALAGQLAVAVRNAQLHEQATRLGEEREAALAAERAAARRIRALYEVSRSFAQSLRLDETLDALARTVVEVLDLDAAVVRMPDERREQLLPRAIYVRDAPFAAPVRTILAQPVPFGQQNVQRLFRDRRAFRLGPGRNRGEQFLPALVPFLEKGWTAAVVPVALPTEVVASLGVFSFRPGNPLSQETIEAATALATPGGPRDRQRPALPAAEAVRRHDAALAAAPLSPRDRGARGRRGVRAFCTRGRRRRRLRLPHAGGRATRRRARRRDRPRRRRHRGHGDGEVRLPLPRARASGAVRLPRRRERRDLQRDRPRQVHQHELRRRRRPQRPGRRRERGAIPRRGSSSRTGRRSRSRRTASCSGSTAARSTRSPTPSCRPAPRSSSTPTASSRRAGTASCTATTVSTHCSRERHELPARALAAAVAEDAREFAGGDLSDDLAVVVIRKN